MNWIRKAAQGGMAEVELGKLATEQKAMKDRLASLSGAEFDRAYMRHVVMDHKKDLAAYRKQARNGARGCSGRAAPPHPRKPASIGPPPNPKPGRLGTLPDVKVNC